MKFASVQNFLRQLRPADARASGAGQPLLRLVGLAP